MTDGRETDPRAFVADWWRRAVGEASTEERRRLLDDALSAVWRRACGTLGAVTLAALLDRVLFDGAKRFGVLRSVSRDAGDEGLRLRVDDDVAAEQAAEMQEAFVFVLDELVNVIGRITADILTPALRSELLALRPAASTDDNDIGDELEPTSDGEERGTSK